MVGMEFLRTHCLKEIEFALLNVMYDPKNANSNLSRETLHKAFKAKTGSKVSFRTFCSWLKEMGVSSVTTFHMPSLAKRREALDELTREGEALGMYHKPVNGIRPVAPPPRAPEQMTLFGNDEVPVLQAGGGGGRHAPDPRFGGIAEPAETD